MEGKRKKVQRGNFGKQREEETRKERGERRRKTEVQMGNTRGRERGRKGVGGKEE